MLEFEPREFGFKVHFLSIVDSGGSFGDTHPKKTSLYVTKGPDVLLYFGYFLFLVVCIYWDSVFFTYSV